MSTHRGLPRSAAGYAAQSCASYSTAIRAAVSRDGDCASVGGIGNVQRHRVQHISVRTPSSQCGTQERESWCIATIRCAGSHRVASPYPMKNAGLRRINDRVNFRRPA